jgi:hypothetical protein
MLLLHTNQTSYVSPLRPRGIFHLQKILESNSGAKNIGTNPQNLVLKNYW